MDSNVNKILQNIVNTATLAADEAKAAVHSAGKAVAGKYDEVKMNIELARLSDEQEDVFSDIGRMLFLMHTGAVKDTVMSDEGESPRSRSSTRCWSRRSRYSRRWTSSPTSSPCAATRKSARAAAASVVSTTRSARCAARACPRKSRRRRKRPRQSRKYSPQPPTPPRRSRKQKRSCPRNKRGGENK